MERRDRWRWILAVVTAILVAPSVASAQAECGDVRGEARPVCEAIVRAIRADDVGSFLAMLPESGTTLIDRTRDPGHRSTRLRSPQEARAAIGPSLRAFFGLDDPASARIRVVHHVRAPGGDVPSFLRIEVRTPTMLVRLAGGPGFRPNLIIRRER